MDPEETDLENLLQRIQRKQIQGTCSSGSRRNRSMGTFSRGIRGNSSREPAPADPEEKDPGNQLQQIQRKQLHGTCSSRSRGNRSRGTCSQQIQRKKIQGNLLQPIKRKQIEGICSSGSRGNRSSEPAPVDSEKQTQGTCYRESRENRYMGPCLFGSREKITRETCSNGSM